MKLTELIEKMGRGALESPLATASGPDDPEIAEIRHAVLDHIRGKCYRAGAKKVFPFDLVRLTLRGLDHTKASVFGSGFFREFLTREARNTLRAEGTQFPESLRVEVTAASGLPMPGEKWLVVEAASQTASETTCRAARLRVVQGEAVPDHVVVDKPRTTIGREAEVYCNGGLHRRNDLAFIADTEVNASVSREHAHIEYDRATGDYRVFNDRWYERGADCGLRIFRRGVSAEVHRDSRGAKLEAGDELHLGRAIVVFEIA